MDFETLVDLSAGTAAAMDRLKMFKKSLGSKEPDARVSLDLLTGAQQEIADLQGILERTPQMRVLVGGNGQRIDKDTGEVLD